MFPADAVAAGINSTAQHKRTELPRIRDRQSFESRLQQEGWRIAPAGLPFITRWRWLQRSGKRRE